MRTCVLKITKSNSMYFMSLTKNIVLVMIVYTHIPNITDYIEGIASPRDYFIEQTREINCVMSCAKQENDANLFASSRRQRVSTYNNNYNIFVHQFLQITLFMKQRYIHTATIYGEFHTVSSLFKKACRR